MIAGTTTDLEFSITNLDRRNTATNISFTDDLDATLSGLVAVNLPEVDGCGEGSLISGISTISLTGGILAPGETCNFTVQVQVPGAAAPGTYTNVTSTLTNDSGFMADPATANLIVSGGPSLSMSFLDDPIANGDSSTLEFVVSNNSTTDSADSIAFSMELDTVIAGITAVGVPINDVCGTGSQLTSVFNGTVTNLVFSGGTLAANDSCTFSVDLQTPTITPSSCLHIHNRRHYGQCGWNQFNGQSSQRFSVGGFSALFSPRLLPMIRLHRDGTVTLEYVITHDESAPAPAFDIAFSDDLNAALAGMAATGLPQSDVLWRRFPSFRWRNRQFNGRHTASRGGLRVLHPGSGA